MESEFNVWLDEVEIIPEKYWKHPRNFIDAPLLKREKTSSHIPTGGAVYFDRGVIEVVTPVIELAPHATARMVRSLWEQIHFDARSAVASTSRMRFRSDCRTRIATRKNSRYCSPTFFLFR